MMHLFSGFALADTAQSCFRADMSIDADGDCILVVRKGRPLPGFILRDIG